MLTTEQVAKAKTFPGCGDITAENSVDKLFASAETLSGDLGKAATANVTLAADKTRLESELATAKAAIPTSTPSSVLKAMASASRIHLKDAIDKQAISPAVAESLASRLIGTDDNLSAVGLTPSASGECVASAVFSALASNGAMPELGKQVSAQLAPKTIAGKPEEKDAPSPERMAELLAMTPLGQSTLAALTAGSRAGN